LNLLPAPGGPHVHCDRDRMIQVVINLLANAAKFVPDGQGRVIVEMRRSGGGYVVRVEDSGPGVPQPYREAIFDKFRQVSGSGSLLKNKPEGTVSASRSAASSSSISAAASGPRTRPSAVPRCASRCPRPRRTKQPPRQLGPSQPCKTRRLFTVG